MANSKQTITSDAKITGRKNLTSTSIILSSTQRIIDTTIGVTATSDSNQRKIVKTTLGKLVLFANLGNTSGTRLRYKTSDDNGSTWSGWNLAFNTGNIHASGFDVYIDSNNDILLAISSGSYITFRKLVYSAGSWTPGTEYIAFSGAYGYTKPVITRRSNNDLWICLYATSSMYYNVTSCYSTNEGVNWTNGGLVTPNTGTPSGSPTLTTKGSNILCIYQTGTTLGCKEYSTSWGTETIIASGITEDVPCTVKISDSEIYTTIRTSSGIKIFKFDGSTWDSGTLLSDNANDRSSSITNINNKPVVIWSDYNGTNYDIVYRKWNGSTWSAQATIFGNTNSNYFSTITSDTAYLILCGTVEGSYYILFDDILFYRTKTILSNTTIKIVGILKTILSNAIAVIRNQTTVISDTKIINRPQKTILANTTVKVSGIQEDITSNTNIFTSIRQYINSDTDIKIVDIQEDITSDADIKIAGIQEDIVADTNIVAIGLKKTIPSDTNIIAFGVQKTVVSDALITYHWHQYINSDTSIKVLGVKKTILSNVNVTRIALYDVASKINTVKQVLSNINNKISLAKRVINDINNYISTAKGKIYDVNNKVNTQGRKIYDITNDVRFIKSWQKAGPLGFQSLGKSYIKVYIATVEQTDVDIDSINIHKQINSAHTASFDLARTYDNATVPAAEAVVEIRYYQSGMVNYWLLFKGYVTSVSPSDSPESITVNCQDEYWKQNQTNKYFFVGHNPYDNREKYYSTIKEALLTELGWSLSIGDFVPEIIDCFGQGQSDIVSSLIEQTGNYGWFYDVDGTRKLWTAGQGSQVNIQRQEIGKNIDIYQLIDHKITTTSETVINRYRVQMGQKVGSGEGGRTYEIYSTRNYEGHAYPAWDRSLERLAKKGTFNGYGFNYTGIDNAGDYQDVFRKYEFEYFDPSLGRWNDRYPPLIEIFNSNLGWGGSIYGKPLGTVKDGFTIDYEKGFITFSEPVFLTLSNSLGEVTAIRAPIIRVTLHKDVIYHSTESESEDANSTVSNPYMFFRDSTGFVPTPTYPNTITKLLNLTGLTHQEGTTYISSSGVTVSVRTFDDTDYAKDYVDWQLSNTCDTKINGTFTLTLDALCFNNIDLSKRIYISGITTTPLNIVSISYNLANFTVSIEVENKRYYKRTVSLPRHD